MENPLAPASSLPGAINSLTAKNGGGNAMKSTAPGYESGRSEVTGGVGKSSQQCGDLAIREVSQLGSTEHTGLSERFSRG